MNNRFRLLISMLVLLVTMWVTPPISSAELCVFGDSYSVEGASTNGRVWVQFLADRLGEPDSTGCHYAVGGHTAIFHLPQQIDEYFEDLSGGSPSKDTIFSVWAGGNDMLGEHHSNLQVPIDAADAVQEQVQRLIDEGARQFVIPDMVPLGLMPVFNAFPLTSNARNAQAAAFVDRLKENVATLRANNRGVKISMIPVTTLVHSMVKYASCYGLMNVTDQFVNAPAGEDPDEYLWWNGVHMTEVGHEIMGNFAADVLLGNIRAVLPLASTLFAGTPEERREFLRRARQRYGSCIYAWGLDLPVADLLQTR